MKQEIDMKHRNDAETAQETNEPKVAGDGIDRRNFLQCMAWAGTGLIWSMVAGVPTSKLLADTATSQRLAHRPARCKLDVGEYGKLGAGENKGWGRDSSTG